MAHLMICLCLDHHITIRTLFNSQFIFIVAGDCGVENTSHHYPFIRSIHFNTQLIKLLSHSPIIWLNKLRSVFIHITSEVYAVHFIINTRTIRLTHVSQGIVIFSQHTTIHFIKFYLFIFICELYHFVFQSIKSLLYARVCYFCNKTVSKSSIVLDFSL